MATFVISLYLPLILVECTDYFNGDISSPFTLYPSDSITSYNELVRFKVSSSGNFRLQPRTSTSDSWSGAEWATGTGGYGDHVTLQDGGELVVFNTSSNVIWTSNSNTGTAPFRLIVSDDIAAYILDASDNVVWSTNDFHSSSTLQTIWSDTFDSDNGWTFVGDVTLPSTSSYCPNAPDKCAKIATQSNGDDSWIETDTYVSMFTAIQFQVDIQGNNLESGDYCEIWWQFLGDDWVLYNSLYTDTLYQDVIIDIPLPNSYTYLDIAVEVDGGGSSDVCYFDNAILRGTLAPDVIWYDTMDDNNNGDWIITNFVTFGEYTQCADVSKLCAYAGAYDGNSRIDRSTNVFDYIDISLTLSVTAESLETDETCRVAWRYDSEAVGSNLVEYTDGTYIDQIFAIPDPASRTMLEIRLNARGDSSGGADRCYWDNVILRGTRVTQDPTKEPTLSPTKLPTQSPTQPPTTQEPTHYPSNQSTETTQLPTVQQTSSPTNPTQTTTIFPTNIPTISPTKNPTHVPTLCPTKQPTFSPSAMPSDNPSLNPTMDPTTPTPNPSFAPTPVCNGITVEVLKGDKTIKAADFNGKYIINPNQQVLDRPSWTAASGSNIIYDVDGWFINGANSQTLHYVTNDMFPPISISDPIWENPGQTNKIYEVLLSCTDPYAPTNDPLPSPTYDPSPSPTNDPTSRQAQEPTISPTSRPTFDPFAASVLTSSQQMTSDLSENDNGGSDIDSIANSMDTIRLNVIGVVLMVFCICCIVLVLYIIYRRWKRVHASKKRAISIVSISQERRHKHVHMDDFQQHTMLAIPTKGKGPYPVPPPVPPPVPVNLESGSDGSTLYSDEGRRRVHSDASNVECERDLHKMITPYGAQANIAVDEFVVAGDDEYEEEVIPYRMTDKGDRGTIRFEE